MTGQSTCVCTKEIRKRKEKPNLNAMMYTNETSGAINTLSIYRTIVNGQLEIVINQIIKDASRRH